MNKSKLRRATKAMRKAHEQMLLDTGNQVVALNRDELSPIGIAAAKRLRVFVNGK